MQLPTEPRLAVPAELVRTALRDPALLARTLPGSRLQPLGDGKLAGTLALWVGDRAVAARGEAHHDASAGDDGVTWSVSADGGEGAGSLDGAVRIEVLPAPGGCRLRVEVTGHAGGWDESVPERAVRHTADRLVGQLARNLEAVLIHGDATARDDRGGDAAAGASPQVVSSPGDAAPTGGFPGVPRHWAVGIAVAVGLVVAAILAGRRRRRPPS